MWLERAAATGGDHLCVEVDLALEMMYGEDGNEVAEVLRQPSTSSWTAAWYAESRGRGVVPGMS